jgi:hypothetical protein
MDTSSFNFHPARGQYGHLNDPYIRPAVLFVKEVVSSFFRTNNTASQSGFMPPPETEAMKTSYANILSFLADDDVYML